MKIAFDLTKDVLVQRYKRFLADTESGLTLHCPNTGAMTGLKDPGSCIAYRATQGTKTAGRWMLIEAEQGLACIDSAAANHWVAAAIDQFDDQYQWRSEVKLGAKRIDFCGQKGDQLCWVEVKGVTLALGDGQGAFPDAVSKRASEHLQVLSERAEAGERAVLMYVIMHNGIDRVRPATEIDPAYAQALDRAVSKGVEIWQWATHLTWGGVEMGAPSRLR